MILDMVKEDLTPNVEMARRVRRPSIVADVRLGITLRKLAIASD